MAMKVIVKDEYLNQFEQVLKKLTEDAVVVRKSLDEENKKISKYRSGKMETTPLGTCLDRIRVKLASQF